MITNRPRPPKQLILGSNTQHLNSTNVYTYLSTKQHGLDIFDMSVAGEFETIVDIQSVSGTLEYLIMSVDNNSGSAVNYGVRVIIDGHVCYSTRVRSANASNETGAVLAGILFFNDTNNEPYCGAQDNLIFEHNIKIEGYVATLTSVDMLVAYRYRLTGLTG